jgi:hypothetical protein
LEKVSTGAWERDCPSPRSNSADLDLESVDTLGQLADALRAEDIELRLASLRAPVIELLERGEVAPRLRMEPSIDSALRERAPEDRESF